VIRRAVPALVAAASTFVLSSLSFIISMVMGVVASMSRYPEAMVDYVLPALGGALQLWLGPLALVGLVVFLAFWLVLPITADSRISGVVAKTIATAVIATLAVGALTFGRIVLDYPEFDPSRELANTLVSAGTTTGSSFIVAAPLIVLAGVFLWIWHRGRGLTASLVVE
jgi:hypothetical protein